MDLNVFTEVINKDKKRISVINLKLEELSHKRITILHEIEKEEQELLNLRNKEEGYLQHEEAVNKRISELYAKIHELSVPDPGATGSPSSEAMLNDFLAYEEQAPFYKEIHQLQEHGFKDSAKHLHDIYKEVKEKEKKIDKLKNNLNSDFMFDNSIESQIKKLKKEQIKLTHEIDKMLAGVKKYLLKHGNIKS